MFACEEAVHVCTNSLRLLMCVGVCSTRRRREEILVVKDKNDLLGGSDLNDVLSSPGILVCACG